MFTNRTMAALFTIAIASSLIVVSDGIVVGSAFADTEKVTNQDPLSSLSSYLSFPITVTGHKSISPMSQDANGGGDSSDNAPPAVLHKDQPSSAISHSANPDDSSGASSDTSSVPAKDLKKLSKCESSAAADGDLTQVEVKDCYSQVF
jgi:hypothetical protein